MKVLVFELNSFHIELLPMYQPLMPSLFGDRELSGVGIGLLERQRRSTPTRPGHTSTEIMQRALLSSMKPMSSYPAALSETVSDRSLRTPARSSGMMQAIRARRHACAGPRTQATR